MAAATTGLQSLFPLITFPSLHQDHRGAAYCHYRFFRVLFPCIGLYGSSSTPALLARHLGRTREGQQWRLESGACATSLFFIIIIFCVCKAKRPWPYQEKKKKKNANISNRV